ncbi:endocuticle structural glycoprotein SgAbd-5-like [Anopheles aquasalis]|uniref:endocuticle structural glycoprotein SgAbd-5-like n=1 Tax=Anopheles aquasalis TaxID=42839 RepID=UPI00215B408D|nr:endocuticle structural glycoprotein SgAbd-5-like [Anopheles aquasalis]
MQSIAALCLLVTLASVIVGTISLPVDPVATPYILRYENNNAANEGYNFEYELSDEQQRQEAGTLRGAKNEEGNEVQVVVVQGRYSFVGDDGRTYWVEYTADENGYRTRMGTADADTDRTLDLRRGKRSSPATAAAAAPSSDAQ